MRRAQVIGRVAFAAVAIFTVGALLIAGYSERLGADDDSAAPEATPPVVPDSTPFRAFDADSWWNTPLPADAPLNPYGDEILDYLSTAEESGEGCLTLAGAGDSPWGHPIYWARPGDPVYDVEVVNDSRPPELATLRIPESAAPAANNDGSMTIFDRDRGYVVALTNATYDEDSDEWAAQGATVTYLDSNGLAAATGRSNDPRNRGSHRGNNGAVSAVRWDMVEAGVIPHVLKIASGPEIADRAAFPLVGSDGDYHGTDPAVPPAGLRLRIDPSVDLDELGLHPQAQIIAETLQRYGAYIGDSGGVSALKLENTVAEGYGQLWDVIATDLCGLPFDPDYWNVIAEGYDPGEDR